MARVTVKNMRFGLTRCGMSGIYTVKLCGERSIYCIKQEFPSFARFAMKCMHDDSEYSIMIVCEHDAKF